MDQIHRFTHNPPQTHVTVCVVTFDVFVCIYMYMYMYVYVYVYV